MGGVVTTRPARENECDSGHRVARSGVKDRGNDLKDRTAANCVRYLGRIQGGAEQETNTSAGIHGTRGRGTS